MKYIILIIVTFMLTTSSTFCQKTENVKIKEWKYGLAIDESGNILYYNYHMESGNFPIIRFQLTKQEISKIKGDKINARSIQIGDNNVRVDDSFKEAPGLIKGHQILKYKIENNAGYVSSDGKKWEKLQIKYLRETGEDDSRGYPIVYVYFECGFFKGEYQLGFGF